MNSDNFVLLDGSLLKINEPILTSSNRGFRYGDGIFETIRVIKGKVFLLEEHLARLSDSAKYLEIEMPDSLNFKNAKESILKLAKKNNVMESGRVRLSLFREDGGFYEPLGNKGRWLIEAEEYPRKTYALNRQGLKIDLFTKMEKPTGVYSNIKSCNSHIYVLASIFKKAQKLDSCLISNTKNRIAEAISSNIFLIKDEKVLTPPLTEGCVAGVMRATVMDLLVDMGIHLVETPIAMEEVFMADELFISDALNGIRWVSNYKIKEYKLNLTREISAELDKTLKKSKTDNA